MRRLIIAFALTLLLPVTGLAGIKKFIQPQISGSPDTATYRITYLCDTVSDLVGITGNTGDFAMVATGASAQLYIWTGTQWALPLTTGNNQIVTIYNEWGGGPLSTRGDFDGFQTDSQGSGYSSQNLTTGNAGANTQGRTGLAIGSSNASTGGFFTTGGTGATGTTIQPGYGQIYYEAVVKFPVLSAATDDYQTGFGFSDVCWDLTGCIPLNPATNQLEFSYTRNVYGTNWYIRTTGGAATNHDTGVTVDADTWYKLGILINAAATEVKFYINGSLVYTASTDNEIPDENVLFAGGAFFQLNTNACTPCKRAVIDYCKVVILLTTAR